MTQPADLSGMHFGAASTAAGPGPEPGSEDRDGLGSAEPHRAAPGMGARPAVGTPTIVAAAIMITLGIMALLIGSTGSSAPITASDADQQATLSRSGSPRPPVTTSPCPRPMRRPAVSS